MLFSTLFHHVNELVLCVDIKLTIDMGYMGLCSAARDAELFLDIARIVILGTEKQSFSFSAREQITVGYLFATVGEPARFPLSVARVVFDFSKEAVQIIQWKRLFRGLSGRVPCLIRAARARVRAQAMWFGANRLHDRLRRGCPAQCVVRFYR